MSLNKILSFGGNNALAVTNFFGSTLGQVERPSIQQIDGLPLGTADGTSTGEVGLKVIVIAGGGGGGGGSTVAISQATPGTTNAVFVTNSSSFSIPHFDNQAFTYYGFTNNIHTQVFKLGSTVVATLTFTYVGLGAANDDNVSTIVQS